LDHRHFSFQNTKITFKNINFGDKNLANFVALSKKLHKPPDPSEANVTKLIGFLSLEERKGVDHFDARRFLMFKGLFRNYGDSFMHLFRPHLERLVEQDQESAHRCAAEIIAGMSIFFIIMHPGSQKKIPKIMKSFFYSDNWNITQSSKVFGWNC
jgi:hypothetical protein